MFETDIFLGIFLSNLPQRGNNRDGIHFRDALSIFDFQIKNVLGPVFLVIADVGEHLRQPVLRPHVSNFRVNRRAKEALSHRPADHVLLH